MGTEPERRSGQTKGKLLPPHQYRIMLRDNGSDPLFIWDIICSQFNMSSQVKKMVEDDLRRYGVSSIVPFTAEVAEHKVEKIRQLTRRHGQCMEAAYDIR